MSHLAADKNAPQPKFKKFKIALRKRFNRALGDYEAAPDSPPAAPRNRSALYLTIAFALLIAGFVTVWSANRFGGNASTIAQKAAPESSDQPGARIDAPPAAAAKTGAAIPKNGKNPVKSSVSGGAPKINSAAAIEKRIAATVQPAPKPAIVSQPAKPQPGDSVQPPRKKSVTIAQPYYQP